MQSPAQLYIGRDPHEGSFLKGIFLFLAGLVFGAALVFLGMRADLARGDGPHPPPAEIANPRIAPPAGMMEPSSPPPSGSSPVPADAEE